MAKVKFVSYLKDVRCRMEDVVFSKWKDTYYMKPYKVPDQEPTEKQLQVRNAFAQLVQNWKQIDGIFRWSWEEHIKGHNMTAMNAFIGANSTRQKSGQPLELFKGFGEEGLFSLNANPGNAGEIICNFEKPVSGLNKHLTFFTQKKVNGTAGGPFTRIDAGAIESSSFTIKSHEPGAEFYVYAILTDNIYNEASSVSSSFGLLTSSGA